MDDVLQTMPQLRQRVFNGMCYRSIPTDFVMITVDKNETLQRGIPARLDLLLDRACGMMHVIHQLNDDDIYWEVSDAVKPFLLRGQGSIRDVLELIEDILQAEVDRVQRDYGIPEDIMDEIMEEVGIRPHMILQAAQTAGLLIEEGFMPIGEWTWDDEFGECVPTVVHHAASDRPVTDNPYYEGLVDIWGQEASDQFERFLELEKAFEGRPVPAGDSKCAAFVRDAKGSAEECVRRHRRRRCRRGGGGGGGGDDTKRRRVGA
jgi:hypothetical protein